MLPALNPILALLSTKGLGRLLVLCTSLLTVFGATYLWGDLESARRFQAYAGYYFCMAALLCALFYTLRLRLQMLGTLRRLSRKAVLTGFALATFGTYLMLLHEPSQMRVFADEPTHALTAHAMAQERHVYYPSMAYIEGGSTVFGEPEAAYRHYFYPFVVSLLHNLTGVRLSNFFIANALIAFLTMSMTFALGWRIGGRPLAGYAAQCLLLGLPLLHHTINSAGYDPLNLLCFVAFILVCLVYLQKGGSDLLDLSISVGILLTYCRSESIIYMVALGVVFLIRSNRERAFNLSWFSTLTPIFLLVPIAAREVADFLSQNLSIFYGVSDGFFGLRYLEGNTRQIISWLFSVQSASLSSWLISGLGVMALPILFLNALRLLRLKLQAKRPECLFQTFAPDLVIICFISLSSVHLFLILCLYWNPADASAVRFLLPALFVLILAIIRSVYWLEKALGRTLYLQLTIVATSFVWIVTLPKAARAETTRSMMAASEAHGSLDWVKAHDNGRTLYAVNSPSFFFVNQIPAITLMDLGMHHRALFGLIEEGYFDQIIIIETLHFNSQEGGWSQTKPLMPLPPNLVLETIDSWRNFIHAETTVRRVLGIRGSDGSVVSLPEQLTEAREWESDAAYFEHIRKLQFFRRSPK